MICPQCHIAVPDIATLRDGRQIKLPLLCPDCLEQQSRRAYLDLQKGFLPGVLAGHHPLRLTHTKQQALPHIVLLGPHRHHAWCGASVTPKKDDRRVHYHEQRLANVCRACREVFDRLVKELPQEVT